MKDCDAIAYRRIFPGWAAQIRGEVESVLLHSGSEEQVQVLRDLFPGLAVSCLGWEQWDLNNRSDQRYDLIVTMNTMMCSPDPGRWFDNVFSSCKYFWFQDLIRARRNGGEECAVQDGDRTRYSMPPRHTASIPNAYDLRKLEAKTVDFYPYHSEGQVDGLAFLMFLRGHLWYNAKHGGPKDTDVSRSDPP